jgi:hypothetical protein
MLTPLAVAVPVTVTRWDTGATCRLFVVLVLPLEPLPVVVVVVVGALPPPPQLRLAATKQSTNKPAATLHVSRGFEVRVKTIGFLG